MISVLTRLISGLGVIVVMLANIVLPTKADAVEDTGGYPWSHATLIRAATYDWGFRSCQPAMKLARTCSAHTSTKLGVTYYQSDPWRYDVRNCTSYVAWRINQVFGISISGWGNANNWDNSARKSGYRVDTTPAIGTIASWEGKYGHVAYVIAVNPDGTVNVEQYNKAGTGEFSRQSRVRADHYLHIATLPTTEAILPAPEVKVNTSIVVPVVTAVADPVTQPAVNNALQQQEVAPLEPLRSTDQEVLPNKPGVTYVPALDDRNDQVNIFAVSWQKTNSGKLEISRTSNEDGNTAWKQRYITEVPISDQKSDYLFSDANADGYLDLYIIPTNPSGGHPVTVLNGARDYVSTIGSWSSVSGNSNSSASYALADYDGNGSLDLYAVSQLDNTVDIKILDGSDSFAKPLANWQTPGLKEVESQYTVGDHNRDGKADIYAVGQEVTVLDAESNYQLSLKSWKKESITDPSE